MKRLLHKSGFELWRVQNAVVFALFFTFLPIAGEYVFNKVHTFEYWIEYQATIPAKPAYIAGETPDFISYYKSNRPVNVRWNDSLFCTVAGEWKGVSSSIKEVDNFVPDALSMREDGGSLFTYPHAIPECANWCRLESVMTLQLSYGVQKTVERATSEFRVYNTCGI